MAPLLNMLPYLALAALLVAVSVIDVRSRIIPNGLILAIIADWAVSILLSALLGADGGALAAEGLVGGLGIGTGLVVVAVVFERATGRESLGGGDVKLLFAVSLFLGLGRGLVSLAIACVLGLAIALVPQRGGEDGPFVSRTMPFGPAISLATCITLLVFS